MNKIYQPAEDSYLLSETLEKINLHNKKILDMGSGSGIQAKTILRQKIKPENLTLADINPLAIKYLKKNFPECSIIKSNLFEDIKDKFNLIVFNPPYLPVDKKEPESSGLATTGGKKGSEIINRFLKDAGNYLEKDGKIILLTSSLTRDINWAGFNKKLLAKKKLFFERLYVFEISEKNFFDKRFHGRE